MNFHDIMSRVRGILADKRISQASFARMLGVSPQTLSGWLMGRNRPGVEELGRMCEVLEVSPSFLMTGREDAPAHQSLVGDGWVLIPRLDVYGSCGSNGHENVDHASVIGLIKVSDQWISKNCGPVTKSALRVYGVDGDSMSPTLEDGDSVIIDTSVTSVRTDSVFVFFWDVCTFIKRIQRIGRTLKIISDNPLYEAWSLNPTEESSFRVMGRVVTKCLVRKA